MAFRGSASWEQKRAYLSYLGGIKMSKKDWHVEGQNDRVESRNDGWWDIILTGGSTTHYNVPSNSEGKSQYIAGWKNAERKK
jgi:hypothetical protein